MEQLINILEEIRPDVDFSVSENLIDEGFLDSFDIASLVDEIKEKFDVEINVEDIVPANFFSAKTIYDLIQSYK